MQMGEWEYKNDAGAQHVNAEFCAKLRDLITEYYPVRVCEHGDWSDCDQGCEHADTRPHGGYIVDGVVALASHVPLDPDDVDKMRWIVPARQSSATTYYLVHKTAEDL